MRITGEQISQTKFWGVPVYNWKCTACHHEIERSEPSKEDDGLTHLDWKTPAWPEGDYE